MILTKVIFLECNEAFNNGGVSRFVNCDEAFNKGIIYDYGPPCGDVVMGYDNTYTFITIQCGV